MPTTTLWIAIAVVIAIVALRFWSRKGRPIRFSLLTALLLTTIVCLTIVVSLFWREIGPLRVEVRQLRNEVGRLSIDDESKIHAIQVRTDDDRTWKWRVWVPEGETVSVRLQWGEVPRTGIPQGGGICSLEPGEQWIELKANRTESGDGWLSSLQTPSSAVRSSILPDQQWFDWQQKMSRSEGVGHFTVAFDSDKTTMVLQRHRVGQSVNSQDLDKLSTPTAGFIIWLERQ